MKVRVDNKIKNYQSLWWDREKGLQVIDQRKLPFTFEIFTAKTIDDACYAISEMVVRGAPLIGATAAYGIVIQASSFIGTSFDQFKIEIKQASQKLSETRPTAVDLFNVLNRMEKSLENANSIKDAKKLLTNLAKKIVGEILNDCRKIGEYGNQIITSKKTNIMTICNAGALATVDIGTALAPIRRAHEEGKEIIVFVPETRPRMQGGRLTAWELENEGIEHYIITDSAVGYYINKKMIDIVIVGADRITLNGDVTNKIGTYTMSLLCKENKVPFYVAAPMSTFELTKSSDSIIIEERDGIEVQTALSINNKSDVNPKRRIIHNINSRNLNPAFDTTPAENITGIITPKGIIKKPYEKSIQSLFKD
ncbi:MAG: S-methyl-5-thioribose-1-phosphate isomerase [Asgard group archaeon]|nr:S-methyl-5-thioribose-1-phosphate isomerase [Asgard group archaeon]